MSVPRALPGRAAPDSAQPTEQRFGPVRRAWRWQAEPGGQQEHMAEHTTVVNGITDSAA